MFRLAESERSRICNQGHRMQVVQICWRKSIPQADPKQIIHENCLSQCLVGYDTGHWAVNIDCMSQSGDMLYNEQRADHSQHVLFLLSRGTASGPLELQNQVLQNFVSLLGISLTVLGLFSNTNNTTFQH